MISRKTITEIVLSVIFLIDSTKLFAQFVQDPINQSFVIDQKMLMQYYPSSGTNWDRGNIGQNLRWSPSLNAWEGAWSGTNKDFALVRFGNGGSINFYNYQGTTFSTVPYSISNSQLDQYLSLSIDINRQVGIGTSAPAQKLDVNGNISNGGADFTLGTRDGRGQGSLLTNRALTHFTGDVLVMNYGGDFEGGVNLQGSKLVIDGSVGIGTTTSGSFKLAVNGKIWGTEVQVALTNPGPDYVFEKEYALPTLESVKTYIDQNKHLPEVPSAKEMEANGINLSEMNMLLLKKVEELTLYVIELKKKDEAHEKEIEELKNKIK